jgi:BASS family bile acid:Na+ symporter
METVRQLIPVILQGSLILMLAAIGMQWRWSDFRELQDEPAVLARAFVAVNVVVPLVAVLVALLLPIERVAAVALLLMAVSPLAPLVPGRALKVGGKRASVLATFVILIALSIVLVPITVKLVGWVFERELDVPVGALTKLVLVSAVLPIVAGFGFAAIAPAAAERLAPILTLLANIVLGLFVLLVLWVAGAQMWALIGNGTILAFAIVTVAGIVAGHLLGGPDWGGRGALAMAASIRHPGMAVMLARFYDTDKAVVVGVLLFLLNGVVLTAIYQAWLKRYAPAGEAG